MKSLLTISMMLLLFIAHPNMIAQPISAQDDSDSSEKQQEEESLQELQQEYMKNNKDQMERQMLLSQIIQVAYNQSLQDELSLVPEQVETVKTLGQEYQKKMMEFSTERQDEMMEIQELIKEGKNREAMEKSAEYQREFVELTRDIVERAEESLLPHQIERLKQISKQQTSKYSNNYGDEFGIPYGLADEIGLTEEEKRKLKKVIEEARKEYYSQVEKLKEEANERILDAIPSEKRDKLNEILGDFYDAEKQQRRTRDELRERQRRSLENKKSNRR